MMSVVGACVGVSVLAHTELGADALCELAMGKGTMTCYVTFVRRLGSAGS